MAHRSARRDQEDMFMHRFSTLVVAAFLSLCVTVAWSGDVKKGWAAYNALDYAAAKAEWQELADAGDAEAAYGIGMLYGNGFGVDMDDALALKYYGIAAEKGHKEAQFNLAVMHQNGWGMSPNEKLANEWYLKAADQGQTQAQMALGRYYAMDFSSSYDPVKAYKWFSLAKRLGDIDASTKQDFIMSRMTAEQIAEGDALVEAWASTNKEIVANAPEF